MPQPEAPTPARADFMQAIQRCAAAYHVVMAEMPKNLGTVSELRHQHKASLAFLAELPILCDLQSFQLYIACIAQGAAIGAIDPVDIGRFCHIAQTAISAWKLANLIVPAAQAKQQEAEQKQREAKQKEERAAQIKSTPLPSKGNHSGVQDSPFQSQQPSQDPKKATPLPTKGNQTEEQSIPYDDWENLYAATKLPDWQTQTALFKHLRDKGMAIPTDEELRGLPAEALRHCETARYFEQCRPLSPQPPQPQPANQHPPAPQQAA